MPKPRKKNAGSVKNEILAGRGAEMYFHGLLPEVHVIILLFRRKKLKCSVRIRENFFRKPLNFLSFFFTSGRFVSFTKTTKNN